MMWKISRRLFLFLILVFLYLPILILAVYSFTESTNIGAIRGFSLDNYVTLFTTPELTGMIAGTITLAIGAAAIATVLGTIGAIGAFYSRKNMSAFISTLNQIPVINADVVTGFSICVLLVVALHISKDSYIPLVAGHVTLCAPFVFLSVMPRIQQMDSSIYEAALDLGATPFKALTQVLLPQIVPGIVSGFALAVTLSLDDYFIAMFDLDNFKQVNNKYDHTFGDKVICAVGELIQNVGDESAGECVARYGCEKFIYLINADSEVEAYSKVESIRKAVRQISFEEHQELQLTISGGLLPCSTKSVADVNQLLFRVDELVVSAKNQGKNQIRNTVEN